MDKVSKEKLDKYYKITKEAYDMAKENISDKEKAEIILDMVNRYIQDSKHFESKNDLVTAFAALNYAHGWLDAGAVLKIFNVKDNRLFTVD